MIWKEQDCLVSESGKACRCVQCGDTSRARKATKFKKLPKGVASGRFDPHSQCFDVRFSFNLTLLLERPPITLYLHSILHFIGTRHTHRASRKFPSSCSEALFARAPAWPPSPPLRREFQRYVSTSSNHSPTPRLRPRARKIRYTGPTMGPTTIIGPVATLIGHCLRDVLAGCALELSLATSKLAARLCQVLQHITDKSPSSGSRCRPRRQLFPWLRRQGLPH